MIGTELVLSQQDTFARRVVRGSRLVAAGRLQGVIYAGEDYCNGGFLL